MARMTKVVGMDRTRANWGVWERFEEWLSGLSQWSSPVLFGGFLAWFVGWTIVAGIFLNAIVDVTDHGVMSTAAGRLMPAVGVLFALLTAFVITNQWNRSRSAEGVVGSEADSCIRLALASQSPGLDGRRIRWLLAQYLHAVLDIEWETLRNERSGCQEAASALSTARTRRARRRHHAGCTDRCGHQRPFGCRGGGGLPP